MKKEIYKISLKNNIIKHLKRDFQKSLEYANLHFKLFKESMVSLLSL